MIQYKLVSSFSPIIALCVLLGMGTSSPFGWVPNSERTSQSNSTAYIELKLTATNANGKTVATDKAIAFYLSDKATDGWDSYDASKMIPSLIDEFALLAFVGEKNGEQTMKAQESRPYLKDEVEVVETRLIRTTNLPSDLTYSLSVTDWYQVPSDWSLKITAEQLDDPLVFDGPTSSHTFSLDGGAKSTSETHRKAASDTTHTSMISEVQSASALPIELASLSAKMDGEAVRVQWRTASETNNAGFAVEHRGRSEEWTEVGFVEGAGTTTRSNNYRYRVDGLSYGTHQFRLRQVDHDGTTTTSRAVEADLRLDGRHAVGSLSPNPVRGQTALALTVQETQHVQVAVYDVQGRRLRTVHDATMAGQQERRVRFQTEDLASGTYFVRVRGTDFALTRRMTVVR